MKISLQELETFTIITKKFSEIFEKQAISWIIFVPWIFGPVMV